MSLLRNISLEGVSLLPTEVVTCRREGMKLHLPNFEPMDAGELRGVMADLGLTYEETAEIVGMTASGISKWLYEGRPIKNVAAVTLLRMLRADLTLLPQIRVAREIKGGSAESREVGLNAQKRKTEKDKPDTSDQ